VACPPRRPRLAAFEEVEGRGARGEPKRLHCCPSLPMTPEQTTNPKWKSQEGFIAQKTLRWGNRIPCSGTAKKPRPSGRMTVFFGRWMMWGHPTSAKLGFTGNRLKQNKMRSPAIGQLRISGLFFTSARSSSRSSYGSLPTPAGTTKLSASRGCVEASVPSRHVLVAHVAAYMGMNAANCLARRAAGAHPTRSLSVWG